MNTVPSLGFGTLLRQLRLAAGLTQEELAERARLSVEAVNTLERGTRRAPRPQTVRLLVEALGLSATERSVLQAVAQQGGRADKLSGEAGQLPTPLVLVRQPPVTRRPLPTSPTPLIGREQEVQAICALLQRSEVRLLTLTGTGGSGKTRLALEAATNLGEAFADGCCFVDLAPLSEAELVVPTIAGTLGIREVPGQTYVASLTAALAEQHLLLLLDNFEQVIGAATAVASLVASCSQVKVMVTSREVLHLQAEYEFIVPPLAIPDLVHLPDLGSLTHTAAVALFLQRAQTVQPGFHLTPGNAHAVVEICARLDGLPLAIELAAARSKLLSPQALLSRLERQWEVLSSETRDVPLRQRTLHNTVAWSYQLLPAQEQRLFQRLALFAGGCTLEAIEALCAALDTEPAAASILDQVAALVDKSLLQAMQSEEGEPRYTLLETIRAFGLEALAGNGQLEATRRAHADYYLRLAEEAEPLLEGQEQREWLERLEREQGNLRAALSWLCERGEGLLALRLASALGNFWFMRGYSSEGRTWLEQTFASKQGEVSLTRYKALEWLGLFALNQGELERAEAYWRENLGLARAMGDSGKTALALGELGLVPLLRGNYATADALLKEAIILGRATEESGFLAVALSLWGEIACYQGEYRSAHQRIEEGLALFQALGSRLNSTIALKALVWVCLCEGDLAQAAALAEECLVICREAYGFNQDETLCLLGEIALWQGDAPRARALAEESLALAQKENGKQEIVRALRLFGKVEAAQGNPVAARRAYAQSLQIAREVGYQRELAPGLEGLAQVAAAQQQTRLAARLWGQAEALRERMEAPLPPIERQSYEQATAAARAHLGEAAFAAAWAEGRSITPEQTLARADE